MKPTVVFIHTITGLKGAFEELASDCLPDCKTCHIADEMLIQRLLTAGGLTPAVEQRVCDHVVAAAAFGADVIQFTCSSISPCAEVAAKRVDVPVLTIDAPMAQFAVARHARIGVIATNPATLGASRDLVVAEATAAGHSVEVITELCDGAYAALFRGDRDTHDQIVLERLKDLMGRVDAVCLAQASMARLADLIEDPSKPVYSSPRPAMETLGEWLRLEGKSEGRKV